MTKIAVPIGKFEVTEESLLDFCETLLLKGNSEGLQGTKYEKLIIVRPKYNDPLDRDSHFYAVREGSNEEVEEIVKKTEKHLKDTFLWIEGAING